MFILKISTDSFAKYLNKLDSILYFVLSPSPWSNYHCIMDTIDLYKVIAEMRSSLQKTKCFPLLLWVITSISTLFTPILNTIIWVAMAGVWGLYFNCIIFSCLKIRFFKIFAKFEVSELSFWNSAQLKHKKR